MFAHDNGSQAYCSGKTGKTCQTAEEQAPTTSPGLHERVSTENTMKSNATYVQGIKYLSYDKRWQAEAEQTLAEEQTSHLNH